MPYALLLFIPAVVVILLLRSANQPYARNETSLKDGQMLFSRHCSACHGLQEEGIGPPLGGITSSVPQKDLVDFIRHPEQVVASGNERAVMLHARYKQMMPSFDWMEDASIRNILSYIDQQSQEHQIKPLAINKPEKTSGTLSGRLVSPVKRSGLKIELEEFIKIPRLSYSTPDLGIVFLRSHPSGGERLFVNDQGGIIYDIQDGKAQVFLDMRDHVRNFSIGPGIATGLGSFDFHPDFLRNGLMYITHAEKYTGQSADYRIGDSIVAEVQWVLSEWKVANMNDRVFKGTHRELLRLHAPTYGHGAQEIAFIPGLPKKDPDYGLLYIGFGDGGSNNIQKPELAHHLRSFLGTILRIDPCGKNSPNGNYGIPSHNPFIDEQSTATLKEIYAYGFRNPHRMTWDRNHNNRMIVADIGESNIEEVNIVVNGGDYGWPNREGIFGIATKKDLKTVYQLSKADASRFRNPFLQYDHTDGHAVSGGHIYEGDLAELRDKYVFGDIVNGRVFYANINDALSDSTVYEISIVKNGKETNLREMTGLKRLHLRIAYDPYAKQLFVITKADGTIWKVVKAYW